MGTTYPNISTQGALIKTFEHFRKSFPASVDSQTLKRLGLAPGNESYVINIFRFLGLVQDDGRRDEAASAFFFGSDSDFAKGMEAATRRAYATLFEEYGADAWDVDRERLATWFRTTDKTTELIGGRQAQTFLTLSALGGHGEVPKAGSSTPASVPRATTRNKTEKKADTSKVDRKPSKEQPSPREVQVQPAPGVGLTVRIEVNLPANGTPEAYDAIFASIRKNLIDPA